LRDPRTAHKEHPTDRLQEQKTRWVYYNLDWERSSICERCIWYSISGERRLV